jgi:hypothetical protein
MSSRHGTCKHIVLGKTTETRYDMSQGVRISMSQIEDDAMQDELDSLPGGEPAEHDEIPRSETGLRILLTLLFVLIGSVLETLLGVIVIFQLIVALATRQPPSVRVREFANRVISYYYRLGRYVTYNESRVPFPFADFPDALETDAWSPADSESKALGIDPRAPAGFEDEEDEDS